VSDLLRKLCNCSFLFVLIFFFRLSIGSYGYNSAAGYVVLIYGAAGLNSVDLNSFIGQFIMGTTAGKSKLRQLFFNTCFILFILGNSVGSRVCAAGDVNGDGHPDMLIGAQGYSKTYTLSSQIRINFFSFDVCIGSNTGRVYLIYGRNGNLPTIVLSSLGSNGVYFYGGTGNLAGESAAAANDINGDGYNDIIIGAPFANNNEGKAYVYFGSNAIPNSVNMPSIGPGSGVVLYGSRGDDYLGWSVCATDVNKDGKSDIIVGKEKESINRPSSFFFFDK
jgi:hypothetical protein